MPARNKGQLRRSSWPAPCCCFAVVRPTRIVPLQFAVPVVTLRSTGRPPQNQPNFPGSLCIASSSRSGVARQERTSIPRAECKANPYFRPSRNSRCRCKMRMSGLSKVEMSAFITERIALSQRERDRLRVLHEVKQKQITQVEAGRRLKVSDRQIRRLLFRLGE